MASRSVRRVDAAHSLDHLFVEIRRDGVPLRTVEIPDPREVFCFLWNGRLGCEGLTAHPVSRATRIAKSVR